MFEMLMLLGFAYAGFCHLFPEGKAARLSFGKKRPAAEGDKRRRKWKPGPGRHPSTAGEMAAVRQPGSFAATSHLERVLSLPGAKRAGWKM